MAPKEIVDPVPRDIELQADASPAVGSGVGSSLAAAAAPASAVAASGPQGEDDEERKKRLRPRTARHAQKNWVNRVLLPALGVESRQAQLSVIINEDNSHLQAGCYFAVVLGAVCNIQVTRVYCARRSCRAWSTSIRCQHVMTDLLLVGWLHFHRFSLSSPMSHPQSCQRTSPPC